MRVSKGFTLIELLIVVSILTTLVILSLMTLTNAQKKARDTRRKNDLRKIQIALETYFNDLKSYPPDVAWCDSSKGVTANGCVGYVGNSWPVGGLSVLAPNYINALPVDPLNNAQYFYYYEPVTTNQAQFGVTCGTVPCAYILSTSLESSGDPDAQSGCQVNYPGHDYCLTGGGARQSIP